MAEMNFIQKLICVQSELKAPKAQHNKFGNYDYRSCEDILEAVKPLLRKYGLLLTICDSIEQVDSRFYVTATCTVTDGTDVVSVKASAREAAEKKGMDDSQVSGAASSYARKYALNGLFLIDDTKDADTNEQRRETQKKAEPAKQDDDVIFCEQCGKAVTGYKTATGNINRDRQIEASKAKFKKVLCKDCCIQMSKEAGNG